MADAGRVGRRIIIPAGTDRQGAAIASGTGKRGVRKLWKWLLWLPLLFVLATALQVALLRFLDPPMSAFMAARQGEAWREGNWDFRVAYDWRDLGDISPYMPLAVIAAEDQNFAGHSGFDLKAIEKAIDHNARGKRVRGGSTISQQVAKNLFLWQGRSWLRKGLEAWYTLLIELMWPKQRIVEVYVNVAEFGDGIYGAQAAARSYWRKDASRLTATESARLAAVLPSPRRYNARNPGPYVQRRTTWIQRQMRQLGGTGYLDQLD
jgi:monofunctional biosynthetic peptidoglycan transglycosylase